MCGSSRVASAGIMKQFGFTCLSLLLGYVGFIFFTVMAEDKIMKKCTGTLRPLVASNMVISHWSLVKASHMGEPRTGGV